MKTIYKKLADLSTNLFKSKYVPFISEVEEFNDMMGKSYQKSHLALEYFKLYHYDGIEKLY